MDSNYIITKEIKKKIILIDNQLPTPLLYTSRLSDKLKNKILNRI